MMRMILLLTVFIFLGDVTTALSNITVSAEKFSPISNATVSPGKLSHRKLYFREKMKIKTVSWKTRNLDTTTIRTLPWKSRDMDKFVKQLEEECNFELLNEIHYELKNLWDNVVQGMFSPVRVNRTGKNSRTALNDLMVSSKKLKNEVFPLILDEREDNLSEMDDVQAFFKKLIDVYNACSEKKLHINTEGEWEIYMKIFGKEYPKGEKEMRKEIFKRKKRDVAVHNGLYKNGFVTYRVNLNHFSDWTEEELKKMNGFRLSLVALNDKSTRMARNVEEFLVYYYNPNISVPASVDWRARGYVNAVKNQGTCNACYAIAGNEALEAYHKKKEGELVRLSAQNILDCTWYLGNNGCDGGNTKSVFKYAKSVGVVSNNWYPYTMNASHDCKWKHEHVAATDEGYYIVDYDDELALWHAVAEHGPVAVVIGINGINDYRSVMWIAHPDEAKDCTGKIFHARKGFAEELNEICQKAAVKEPPVQGVFYTDYCGPLEHAVLVVGYGTDPEQGEYWLVKNCWGFWWGEDGYIRIARNKFNVCSIASYAHFPY